jgi:hypothetical protein
LVGSSYIRFIESDDDRFPGAGNTLRDQGILLSPHPAGVRDDNNNIGFPEVAIDGFEHCPIKGGVAFMQSRKIGKNYLTVSI